MKIYSFTLFLLLSLSCACTVMAADLRIAFGEFASPPHEIVTNGRLTGGVVKDIGDALALRLGLTPVYIEVPRKRLTEFLETAHVHCVLNTNPAWLEDNQRFHWAGPLLEEQDVLVMRSAASIPIHSFDDLHGKRIGCILGFRYPTLADRFKNRAIIRDDAKSFISNIKRLDMGWVDAIIISNIVAKYHFLKNHSSDRYVIGEKPVSTNGLYAAMSQSLPLPFKQFDAAFQDMMESGIITDILLNYTTAKTSD